MVALNFASSVSGKATLGISARSESPRGYGLKTLTFQNGVEIESAVFTRGRIADCD